MTAFLPPNLLALFAPRDPIPYLQPSKLPHEKKRVPYAGVSSFLKEFEDPKDTPPPTRVETKDEKRDRKRKERAEQVAYKLEQDLAMWDPQNDPIATEDGFKTLYVARINFDTSESKLRREFETYGPIKKIRLVSDQNTGKPRGYAFIEFEHERDMHSAYKHADGKKIDGRRVLVDVERARTVKGWRPRRLGGGLGQTRKGGAEENSRFAGRDDGTGARADSRERDRGGSPDRAGRRHRSRSRERRRSRSRERRPRRSRSRERRRSRDRAGEGEEKQRRSRSRERKRTRRSRSRDRGERKRRRSRSKERTIKRERSKDRDVRGENEDQPPPPSEFDDDENYMSRAIKPEPEEKGHYGGKPYNGDNGAEAPAPPPADEPVNEYGSEAQ